MKVTRSINKKELKQLLEQGYVLPTTYNRIEVDTKDKNCCLVLNILRSKLDIEDGQLFAPTGYRLNNVLYAQLGKQKLDLKRLEKLLNGLN